MHSNMIGDKIGRARYWLMLSVVLPFVITCLIVDHTTFERMIAVLVAILSITPIIGLPLLIFLEK